METFLRDGTTISASMTAPAPADDKKRTFDPWSIVASEAGFMAPSCPSPNVEAVTFPNDMRPPPTVCM